MRLTDKWQRGYPCGPSGTLCSHAYLRLCIDIRGGLFIYDPAKDQSFHLGKLASQEGEGAAGLMECPACSDDYDTCESICNVHKAAPAMMRALQDFPQPGQDSRDEWHQRVVKWWNGQALAALSYAEEPANGRKGKR